MLHLWRHAANWACPRRVWSTIGTARRSRTGDWRAWWAEQMRRPIQ